jgi:hypothetical protein
MEVNAELKKEAEFFQDMVIVPFIDSYDLVVLKSIAIAEYGVSYLNLSINYVFVSCVFCYLSFKFIYTQFKFFVYAGACRPCKVCNEM